MTYEDSLNMSYSSDETDIMDDHDSEYNTCPHCDGTGGDPMDNYCTKCEHCDGEGYQWWLA
jgi:DnaJ-class molecular chaperone